MATDEEKLIEEREKAYRERIAELKSQTPGTPVGEVAPPPPPPPKPKPKVKDA